MVKKWFKLMWGANYIQVFFLPVGFLVAMFYYRKELNESPGAWWLALIPIVVIIIICYLGFYKFWQNNKHLKDDEI